MPRKLRFVAVAWNSRGGHAKSYFLESGNARKPLTEKSERQFERILHQLHLHRSAQAQNVNHWMYRMVPERWLESMVLDEPTRLDAQLDERFFYSQMPAFTSSGRGVIDLLGITRQGRLVVIELKA